MNERLTLQDLIDLLAEKQGRTKKDAESFLRELFAVITENIENNESVKIKDFGTFKLVKVNARKSVDVNTGESIEIPSHYKLSFIPDKSLKEAVNRPFAHFESVLLEDGVTFEKNVEEELESVDVEEYEIEIDEIESIENNEINPFLAESSPKNATEESDEEIDQTVKDDQLEQEDTNNFFSQSENEAIGNENNVSLNEEKESVPNTIDDNEEVPTKNYLTYSSVDDEEMDMDDGSYIYKEGFDKKWTIIVVILIAILSFVAGYFYSSSTISHSSDNESTLLEDDSAMLYQEEDTLSTPIEEQLMATAKDTLDKNIDQPANVKDVSDKPSTSDKVKKVKLKQGRTMRMMGLEYYGNKSFWVYIYEENKSKIPNPNSIPLGTELIIPPASKYGIDANDPKSVEKAISIEQGIFKKFK